MSPVNGITNNEANQLLTLADNNVTQHGNILSTPTVVYNQHTHRVVHQYKHSGAAKGDAYPHVPNRMILLQKIIQNAALAKLFPGLFASQEMKTCFETVLSSNKDFVVVLPTGSGKSLFWLYPAMLDHNDGDITIVIVPLVSVLLDQSAAFALQKNVRHIVYIPSITTSESLHLQPICDTVRVVFVQAEHVRSPAFKYFCNSMGTRLGRFIVDECHLMIEHRDFRPIMLVLMSTLSHYVTTQKVYVTATLPWKKQMEFLTLTSVAHGPDAIHVSPQLLAMPSIPPNIGFHVIMVDTKNEAKITLSIAVKEWLQGDQKERLIIFCLSIDMCYDLKSLLDNQDIGTGIHLFHSRLSKAECKDNLTRTNQFQSCGGRRRR
jgi:superfamily II DNA helicase RecQ